MGSETCYFLPIWYNIAMEKSAGWIAPDFGKLVQYGFAACDGIYTYKTPILDGQFVMTVQVGADGSVGTVVTDAETDEAYTLHLVEGAEGAFVGKVRAEYAKVLDEIRTACFGGKAVGEMLRGVIAYIREKYGDELEYLWDDDNAIWRRADNKKWYGVAMKIDGAKLGLRAGRIEIIDLRIDPVALDAAVDGRTKFRGYHMHKKRWITLLLDGSVPQEEICDYIDASYVLAADKPKRQSKKG